MTPLRRHRAPRPPQAAVDRNPSSPSPVRPRLPPPRRTNPKNNVLQIDISDTRLWRFDRRERRPRTQSQFLLRKGIRLSSQDHAQRRRNLVAAQQWQACRYRHDRRRARSARPQFDAVVPVQIGYSRGAVYGRGGSRRCIGQSTRGQGAGRIAVQRKRILHSLLGAGGGRAR